MYEPTRGGTRGGQAEFKWADVGQDKDREHYLGHSINAPTGRWQKNKDVHWYNREKKQTDEEKQLEIAKIKEAEREAMSVALGFKPSKPPGDATTSGANAIPVAGAPQSVAAAGIRAVSDAQSDNEDDDDQKEDHKLSKEEKRLRKIEKKLGKAERKRQKREEKEALAMQQIVRQRERERPRSSRSASPARRGERSYTRNRDRSRGEDGNYRRERLRSRERSPRADRDRRTRDTYDEAEMERERAKDRKRWEDNLARQEKARGNWD